MNTIQMRRRILSWEQKRDLASDAMRAAIETRFEVGVGLEAPLCAYAACEHLGVVVRFVDINMEGIYRRRAVPRIFLSVHRPLARRHFSCAHELGHHIFGHGTNLDELQDTIENHRDHDPNEFLADCFAGHLLMPVFGIRRAFTRRGIEAMDARPEHFLAIATEFGVTYEALLTQLAFALKDITTERRDDLLRARSEFRRSIMPETMGLEVAVLDDHFVAPTLDVETGHLIVAPNGTVADDDIVTSMGNNAVG